MVRFSVTLKDKEKTLGTFRFEEEKVLKNLQKQLEPYRSLPQKVRPVKCVETGDILKGKREVANWLMDKNIDFGYSYYQAIKAVCNGKRETAYGYHWVHLEDLQKIQTNFKW